MRSSFADRGLPLNHSYNDEPDTPILRAGLSVMLFTRQKSLSRSRNLFSVLSIGFPFFKRLGGDIDPLELNQPFAGVRSERFWTVVFAFEAEYYLPEERSGRSSTRFSMFSRIG